MSVFVRVYTLNHNLTRPLFTFHKASEHITSLDKKYKHELLDGRVCLMVEFEDEAEAALFKLTWSFNEHLYQ